MQEGHLHPVVYGEQRRGRIEINMSSSKKIDGSLFQVLPVPVQMTPAGKTKSMKKDEQYRVMFAELEKFLASHSRTDKHSKVSKLCTFSSCLWLL